MNSAFPDSFWSAGIASGRLNPADSPVEEPEFMSVRHDPPVAAPNTADRPPSDDPGCARRHPTSDTADVQRVARRALLTGGLAAAWAGATAETARGQGALPLNQVNRSPLLALVNRVTQGFTRSEWTLAQQLGYDAYLEHHLAYESIDDSALETELAANLPTLALTAKELFDGYGPQTQVPLVPMVELQSAALLRAVQSPRQLFERMVEFWTDHFNVSITDGLARYLKTVEDRDVMRAHAMDNFELLLQADAKGAAMLFYLDNYTNVANGPNENYAREVMELHTLGVDGPYHEQDVSELARCFTGWSFLPPQSPNHGQFLFRANVHDTNSKTVIDLDIPAGGGVADGEDALSYLAGHAATAEFVSRKLAAWLTVYEPSQTMVDRIATTFLTTGGDIREMIRVALNRQNLLAEDPFGNPKLKRPFHYVSSLLRAVDANVVTPQGLLLQLQTMQNRPFTWPSPDGFPDSLDDWGGSVLARWSFASSVIAGQIGGVSVPIQNLVSLIGQVPQAGLANAIDRALTGGRMTPQERAAIQTFIDSFSTVNGPVLREAFALAASSPTYQFI